MFALGLIVATPAAFAWGQEGHRVVATIAYARLLPAVRAKVDAMLAADTDPPTAADFASRSTWADLFRDSDRGTTRVRYDRTGPWHYVDIELGARADAGAGAGADSDTDTLAAACHFHRPLPRGVSASAGPAASCVVDKIDQFAAELHDPITQPAERLLALLFVMHFVGDLHQPLHSADRHDQGGNQVPVLYGTLTTASNLHSYWDTWLVRKLGRDEKKLATTLDGEITDRQSQDWSAGTPSDWAEEAWHEARDVAYAIDSLPMSTDASGVPARHLSGSYERRALPVVRLQLSRAGVRLAAVLNAALR